MTPYEAWHGSKPVASNLRVFGCDAYAHIPKNECSKFDSKARKCILLGYGQETKGYRLYDTAQRKVIHSRDVRFNEDVKESEHSTLDVENDGDYRLVLDFTDNETGSQPDTPTETEAPEVLIRRSTRQKCPPQYLGREECNILQTPPTFKEAASNSENSRWKSAMDAKMKSWKENDVWDLVSLPAGRKTAGNRMNRMDLFGSGNVPTQKTC